MLVSYGCHVHADGFSPLRHAVEKNSVSIVAALLSARLQFPDTVSQALATLDFSGSGYAPLHIAVMNGYLKCAKLLIDAGADVNAVCGAGVTALQLAVESGGKKAVQLLLQVPSCQVDSTILLNATSHGSIVTLHFILYM